MDSDSEDRSVAEGLKKTPDPGKVVAAPPAVKIPPSATPSAQMPPRPPGERGGHTVQPWEQDDSKPPREAPSMAAPAPVAPAPVAAVPVAAAPVPPVAARAPPVPASLPADDRTAEPLDPKDRLADVGLSEAGVAAPSMAGVKPAVGTPNVGGNLAAARVAGDQVAPGSDGPAVLRPSRDAVARTRPVPMAAAPAAAPAQRDDAPTAKPASPQPAAAGRVPQPESRTSVAGAGVRPGQGGAPVGGEKAGGQLGSVALDADVLVEKLATALASNLARAMHQSIVEAVDAALGRSVTESPLGPLEEPVQPRFIMSPEPASHPGGSRAA